MAIGKMTLMKHAMMLLLHGNNAKLTLLSRIMTNASE